MARLAYFLIPAWKIRGIHEGVNIEWISTVFQYREPNEVGSETVQSIQIEYAGPTYVLNTVGTIEKVHRHA